MVAIQMTCFNILQIINIFILIFIGINIFLARLCLEEIYTKDTDFFFKYFDNDSNRFPVGLGRMSFKTQLKLYKMLLFNENNIKNIVGNKQVFFKLILLGIIMLLVFLLYCIVNLVAF